MSTLTNNVHHSCKIDIRYDKDPSAMAKNSSAMPRTELMTLPVSPHSTSSTSNVLMTMTDVSSQAPWTAEVLHTIRTLVFSNARVLRHVAPKVSGRQTALATHLAVVGVVATVNGLVLVEAMSCRIGATTLCTSVLFTQ